MPRGPATLFLLAGLAALAACSDTPLTGPAPVAAPSFNASSPDVIRHVFPVHAASRAGALYVGTASGGKIVYHGGPVVGAQNVVAIYWAKPGRQPVYRGGPVATSNGSTGVGAADGSLVGFFLNNIGGTGYYNINTTYSTSTTRISNTVNYAGYWVNDGSFDPNEYVPGGTDVVTDAQMQTMLGYGFAHGYITYDPNTVYAIFTADSVNLGGNFHTQYCAYHGTMAIGGQTVLYAAMPDDYAYPSSCAAQTATPNGDPHADTEVSTLIHEIEETNTDARLSAWWDNRGYENADKCAWTWGSYSTTSSGAAYNIALGATSNTRNFLIQRNWVNVGGGKCAMSY